MRHGRALGAAILGSVASFLVLVTLSIAYYPGGTFLDPNASGHDLFRNFLCDLTQPSALNGRANPTGAVFGKAAMLTLGAGLYLVWLGVGAFLEPLRRRTVAALGTISFLGTIAVPLTPSLRLGTIHGIAVVAATIPGLAACLLSISALLGKPLPVKNAGRIGVAALVVSAIDAALYVDHLWRGGATPLLLPLLQRVALMLVLALMTSVALLLCRAPRGSIGISPGR